MSNTKISMETSTAGSGDRYKRLSPEAMNLFQEGIYLVLSRWSALQLALWNKGDGCNADKLAFDIFSTLTRSSGPPYDDALEPSDVEGILEDKMDSLDTIAADDSIPEVARKLVSMREECFWGNYTSIEKLRQTIPQRATHQHIRQVVEDEDEDEEGEGEEEDDRMEVDKPKMLVDSVVSQSTSRVEVPVDGAKPKETAQAEDGWVVVSCRRNKGRRK